MAKMYWVYILTNRLGTLYVGMTSDLERRIAEHRAGHFPNAFTARYAMDRLIYAEPYDSARDATQRERQLKAWRREKKKVALINAANPTWRDLTAGDKSSGRSAR
ncbi:MAG: GIY-YIG nuclease family protein [Rhodothermales bacterium]